MKSEHLRFPGARGATLAARLDSPAGTPAAYALFAHCFTCSKDLKAAGQISSALTERGIAVLRFDFTGLGESEGDFAGTDFSSNVDDLVAAADFLRRERQAPRLLVGHSLGGCAVLAAAERIPEVRAVSTIGAPSDTGHLHEALVHIAPELAASGEAEVRLGGRPFKIRRELLDDLDEGHLRGVLERLHRALLIFHSPVDNIVGIDHARRLFDMAKHPKSFISLDTADHLLTDERDARYAGEVLAVWAERYLQAAMEGTTEPEAGREGEVLVVGPPSGFAQEIIARGHRLRADEPVEVGGTGTGPTPYDLLLGALGACTSMTLRMYADRKQLPLEGVRVRLRYSKIHAVDCARCETKEGKIDRIERDIEVVGPLDPEQRLRLLEMADRCPVHRTLTSEIDIVTRLS
jgi:uncharacterized OsmC-like protein/alpha/beta superfamily hydrolase